VGGATYETGVLVKVASQYEDDEYEDDDDYENGDSSVLTQLRRENRQLKKNLKTIESERDQFRNETRGRVVAEAVRAAGFPDAVASLIPPDTDPDGVGAWLEKNGALFARANTEPGTQADTQSNPQQLSQEFYDPEETRAVQALNALSGSTSGGRQQALDPIADLKAKIEAATTQEELNDVLRNSHVTAISS